MANDISSKALNPNSPDFSPARISSPRTIAAGGEVSMSVSRLHSSQNPVPTPLHANAKNNGFSFPYTYQGTTYYTRPPPPPPLPPPLLPHDSWVPFYIMNHMMENGYSIAQSNGYSHHHGNGYVQSFNTDYSNQYHTGYTVPHYNNNFHQHFYNYNCSNTFPFPTPYINGNPNSDLSAPFTNQISHVHGIRSGLIGQQTTPIRQDNLISDNGQAGNGEWKKKKKKNKRNKRKKPNKNKDKKNGDAANSGDEVDIGEDVPDETNGNHADRNGEFEAHSDGNQVHDNGVVDVQAISNGEVNGKVNSEIAVKQNAHVDTEVKSNGKADLSNLLSGDLFYEYAEVNDEVNGMNNGNDEQQRQH